MIPHAPHLRQTATLTGGDTLVAAPSTCWVGIDVSKAELQLHSHDSSLKLPAKLANDACGLRTLLKLLASSQDTVHVVFEASGGYDKPLLDHLHGNHVACSRLNPRQVRDYARFKGRLAKTDAIDAATLAELGATEQPAATPPPDPALEELMAQVNYRRHLLEELAREQMQEEHPKPRAIVAMIRSRIADLKKRIAKLDGLIDGTICASSFLKSAVAALVEVKGVGKLTAAALLASMPELGTLTRNQAAALAGLAPFNRDSGSIRGKRTIQGGRAAARQALYMSALVATRHNEHLAGFYQNLVAKGKPKKLALTAVMRKLLIHLNSIMRNLLERQAPEITHAS